jgi:hypothetical protein
MNTTNVPEITTIEALVAEARRRGFNVTGGFHPPHLIPMVQAAILQHNSRERGHTETSGDYIEWKQTMDNLQEFLALLKTLPERLPYESASKTSTSRTKTSPASLPSRDDADEEEQEEDEDDDDDDEDENDFDDEDDDEEEENDSDSLIEKVEKYLAENRPNRQSTRPQPNTTVRPQSDQASDPRLNPVCDPSQDASDAVCRRLQTKR